MRITELTQYMKMFLYLHKDDIATHNWRKVLVNMMQSLLNTDECNFLIKQLEKASGDDILSETGSAIFQATEDVLNRTLRKGEKRFLRDWIRTNFKHNYLGLGIDEYIDFIIDNQQLLNIECRQALNDELIIIIKL